MISREAFDSATEGTKLLLIYDMLVEQHNILTKRTEEQLIACERRNSICESRFLKIERRKIINVGAAGVGGVVGGIIAIVTKTVVWWK